MQLASSISLKHVLYGTGFVLWLALFIAWLLKTSFGRRALSDSPPRRNNMRAYLPLIPMAIWFAAITVGLSITEKLLPDLPEWQLALLKNLVVCVGATAATVVILCIARVCFARRLKGFGLDVKSIFKDLFAGALNLLAVYPLILLAVIPTLLVGKYIFGPDFEISQHEELKLITAHPQLSLRIMVIIVAVVVAPVFEELLFRGLFQTVIRSQLTSPWLSIALTSVLFTIVHQEPGHWLSLFVLSMCLGYAYEKSGSLFRPIFIHAFFNAVTIVFVLQGVYQS
jgi:membrane protease YdiL (CAAX protease family)